MSELKYDNYINAFYDLLQVNPPSANAQLLYYTLIMEYSSTHWQSVELQRTNSYICSLCGLSRKAVINAQKELKRLGLIDFTVIKKNVTVYRLLTVENIVYI